MALTKGITRKVEIPHEEGAWLELRQLNYRQLAEARRVKLDELFVVMKGTKDIALPGETEEMRELKKRAQTDPAAAAELERREAKAKEDALLGGYDIGVLLRHGIVAWSYGETVTPDELDERTAQWAAREIVALSVPDEAAVGKASSPSTAISADPVPLRRSG